MATCSSAEFGEWEIQEPEPEEKEFKVGAKVKFTIIRIEDNSEDPRAVARVVSVPCEGVIVEALAGLGEGMWMVKPKNGMLKYIRHEDDMELI